MTLENSGKNGKKTNPNGKKTNPVICNQMVLGRVANNYYLKNC